MKTDWVVAGGAEGEAAHCTRCGEALKLGSTQPVAIFLAASKAFIKLHARCKKGDYREPIPTTAEEWRNGRDTGISSLTIYSVMTGEGQGRYDIPHDPSDFGRCHRLLNIMPEWRDRLTEVATKFPEWGPFVQQWPTLERMYEAANRSRSEYAHEMFDFMQTLASRFKGGA